jgi:hypothetical protein
MVLVRVKCEWYKVRIKLENYQSQLKKRDFFLFLFLKFIYSYMHTLFGPFLPPAEMYFAYAIIAVINKLLVSLLEPASI